MSSQITKKRLLTGDRPSGKLHLGHYVGSIQNRIKLQNDYECYFIVADLHTLTTKPQRDYIKSIPENIRDMILDYFAAGIQPNGSYIYLQSAIRAVYELNLIFEMLVTVPRLQRIPSIKDMARDANLSTLPFGLLGYPVLQAADILMARAEFVPVGKDNVSHIELAREISRDFNSLYDNVFPEPQWIASEISTLPGCDGTSKMSKSAGNTILLTDEPNVVKKKIMQMYTDPARIRADIPGNVEGNPVFTYHDAFNKNLEEVEDLKLRYKQGKVGDVEVKNKLIVAINALLEPIQEQRRNYEKQKGLVEEVIFQGTEKTRKEADETLELVREAMGLSYRKSFNIT